MLTANVKTPPAKNNPVVAKGIAGTLSDQFFGPQWVNRNWFPIVVGILGALAWIWFFNGAQFTAYDWPKEMSYWSVLKESLSKFVIPWRSTEAIQLETDRFLTIPEISFAPQDLLLWVLDIKTFVVANLLILYTIGFLGCVRLARRFQLSGFGFLFFVIVFNFNGYFTSRFSVGHQMWASLFYFPWLIGSVFNLIARPRSRRSILEIALILFLVLLQGGIHQFVWCNMLLGLLFLFRPSLRMSLFLAMLFAGVASSYRILPSAWAFWHLQHPFLTGYPSLEVLLHAFTAIGAPNTSPMGGLFIPVGWWEFDIYVGATAFLALIWYGLFSPKANRNQEISENLALFGSAMIVLFCLSISDVYYFVHQMHLPLLNSEAVSARFIIIPFFLLLLMTADALSIALNKQEGLVRIAAIILLFTTCYQLYLHSMVWRVASVEQMNHATQAAKQVGPLGEPDPTYRSVIMWSYALSLASVGAVIYWWRQGLKPTGPAAKQRGKASGATPE